MASTTTPARLETGFAAAFTALCLGAVAMGISPLFVRIAKEAGVGPFASAFWRVALALPVLYAWMRIDEANGQSDAPRRFKKEEHRIGPKSGFHFWVRCSSPATILAGLAFTGDLLFWHLAILKTTIANATFFATTAPLFVVLITWFVLRQRVSKGSLIGLALCLAGGGALIGQSLKVDPGRITGDLFGLATALFFGLYFVLISRARETSGAARVTFEATLITAALLLAVALIVEGRLLPAHGSWFSPEMAQLAAALIAMGVISHAGGQGLLSVALGRLPAVFSSLVIFLEAIVAAVAALIVLAEALTLPQICGGALILIGIWIARPRPKAAA